MTDPPHIQQLRQDITTPAFKQQDEDRLYSLPIHFSSPIPRQPPRRAGLITGPATEQPEPGESLQHDL